MEEEKEEEKVNPTMHHISGALLTPEIYLVSSEFIMQKAFLQGWYIHWSGKN